MPILVPGGQQPVPARLAEDLATPEDDIAADRVGDQFNQSGIHGEIEKRAVAAHAFGSASTFDMRAHEFFRAHAGVVGDQAIERGAHRLHLGHGQPPARHDIALERVAFAFPGGQMRHGAIVCAGVLLRRMIDNMRIHSYTVRA